LTHALPIKPDDFAGYPDGWDELMTNKTQDDLALYAKIIRDNIRIDQSVFVSHFNLMYPLFLNRDAYIGRAIRTAWPLKCHALK
jgi:hypothetical protein